MYSSSCNYFDALKQKLQPILFMTSEFLDGRFHLLTSLQRYKLVILLPMQICLLLIDNFVQI